MSDKPFSRRSPQTEYTTRPDHYENDDVPHVLARVRFMLRFMSEGALPERAPRLDGGEAVKGCRRPGSA